MLIHLCTILDNFRYPLPHFHRRLLLSKPSLFYLIMCLLPACTIGWVRTTGVFSSPTDALFIATEFLRIVLKQDSNPSWRPLACDVGWNNLSITMPWRACPKTVSTAVWRFLYWALGPSVKKSLFHWPLWPVLLQHFFSES